MKDPERLFACRLAMALGKSLTEIARMPNSEFLTWRAYSMLEPFGSPTDDQRFAAFMTLFWKANSTAGSETPEFFKRWELPSEEAAPSPQTLDAKIKSYFRPKIEQQKRKRRKRNPGKAGET